MGTRIQSQTSQIERQAQGTKHQIGTAGCVGHHVHSRTESTDKNAYDNRASCKSQLHGSADTGDSDRYCSQCKAEDNAHEYSNQIRFFQALDSIAQYFFHILYGSRLTYYRQSVAQLQSQFRRSQQLHATAIYATDIDAVMIAQMQRTQFLSVQFGTCHHDTLRNQLAVNGIPVDILLVPVRIFLFAEQHRQCRRTLFGSDDQQTVTFFNHLLGSGNTHIPVPPQTRYHEFRIAQLRYILYAHIKDCRIVHLECNDIWFVHIVFLFDFQIFLTHQHFAYQQDTENHSHYAQRICHRTSQSRSIRLNAHLFQGLLCGTQRRGIGRGTTEDTHHVRQGNSQSIAAQHRHHRTDQHHAHCQHIQLHTTRPERTEKARTDLQSQCIHEYH